VPGDDDEADDDEVAAAGHREGVRVCRGAVDDVPGAIRGGRRGVWRTFVIRATADNPAVDIEAAGRVLEHLAGGADYVVETGLPYGCAVEGIRLDVMRQADKLAVDARPRTRDALDPEARPAAFCAVAPQATALARPDLRFTMTAGRPGRPASRVARSPRRRQHGGVARHHRRRRSPRPAGWCRVIAVTRLDGTPMIVNTDQIAWIEYIPDTVISLMNGEKLIVRETPELIVERVREFRRSINGYVARPTRGVPLTVIDAQSGGGDQ
jgi:flagellar protein FlbD